MDAKLVVTKLADYLLVEDEIAANGCELRISVRLPVKDYRLVELQAEIWKRAAETAQQWSQGVQRMKE